MPLDKTQTSSATGKPLMPRLAATASNTKSPITPRLATQHIRGTPSPSSVGVSSPRSAIRSPPSKDDLKTPAKSLLNNNVTPRSSSRKSRIVETTSSNSNPTTPTLQQSAQSLAEAVSPGRNTHTRQGAGGVSSPVTVKRPKSVIMDKSTLQGLNTLSPSSKNGVTFSPTVPNHINTSPRDELHATGGSFFHANDVASNISNVTPIPQPQVKKAATFFYASGGQEEGSGRNPRQNHLNVRAPSPTLSTISMKSHKSQFYHADGTPDDVKVAPLPAKVPSPELPTRNGPRLANQNQSQTQTQSPYIPAPFRPPSPLKNSSIHLTYRKGASQIISPQTAPVMPAESANPVLIHRNVISPTRATAMHDRSNSLSSLDTTASSPSSSRKASLNVQFSGPAPTSAPIQSMITPSPPSPPSISALPSPELVSPTSATAMVPSSFAELAANARRERKVLDLEISNSSLLAVNKQLERELRRQKAEVRRWRRLTRAGRIESLGSVASSMLSGAGLGSDIDESGDEEDEEDKLEADESADDDVESETEGSISLARLERDEKRLRLDLSRHRQLLVDSQRMNQSLKRCMAWTEEMIGEAKRALDYKVRVSDVKLGGRVLHAHDEDQDDDLPIHDDDRLNEGDEYGGDPDLSSSFSVDPRETPDLVPSTRKGISSSATGAERDSGVVLDGEEIMDEGGLGIKHIEVLS